MFKTYSFFIQQLRAAFILLTCITFMTGIVYPMLITAVAQTIFNHKANGSLIVHQETVIGSSLIGQDFTETNYFWGRPSATTPSPYSGDNSASSNLASTNPKLLNRIKQKIEFIRKFEGNDLNKSIAHGQTNSTTQPMHIIPMDLLTTSASGLDPEISPYAALYQVPRVAKVRNIAEDKLQKLIQLKTKSRTFGILGEPRINVLELNLALDNGDYNNL